MEEIIFIFNNKKLILQCNINEKMKDILKRYSSEIKKDINSLYFINNSKQIINQEIILSDYIKTNSNENTKFCVIVKEKNNETNIVPKNKDNDKIILKYKIDKNNNSIKIFGHEFVKNNKDKCKIIFEEKEDDLKTNLEVSNINKDYWNLS